MADRSVITAENVRDTMGVGSVINTKHSGVSKRPAESAAEHRLDHEAPVVPPAPVEARETYLDTAGNVHYKIAGKEVSKQVYFDSR